MTKLILIKSIHTTIWLFMNVVIFYLLYAVIINKIDNDPLLKQSLLELDGKTLGCWCHPDPCHGDILIELIHKYKN